MQIQLKQKLQGKSEEQEHEDVVFEDETPSDDDEQLTQETESTSSEPVNKTELLDYVFSFITQSPKD